MGQGRRRKPRSRNRRSEPYSHRPSSVHSMRDFKDRNISTSSRCKNFPTSVAYKQIKIWFQNQRIKCKRWQKYNWPKNSHPVTQMSSAITEYLGLSSCPQECLVNASGNLSMWSNHSWTSPSWNYPAWNGQTWCPQAWNNQAWNSQFCSYGEEALQPQIQFQQNPVSDLEASLEIAGETYDAILQAPKYYGTQQSADLFPDYSLNV